MRYSSDDLIQFPFASCQIVRTWTLHSYPMVRSIIWTCLLGPVLFNTIFIQSCTPITFYFCSYIILLLVSSHFGASPCMKQQWRTRVSVSRLKVPRLSVSSRQAGIFPANPRTLFVGNSQSHRKSLRICIKFLKNLMNIEFKVHLKVYKWKISTIILNLQMFQG